MSILEKFKAFAELPYGEAQRMIQTYASVILTPVISSTLFLAGISFFPGMWVRIDSIIDFLVAFWLSAFIISVWLFGTFITAVLLIPEDGFRFYLTEEQPPENPVSPSGN